MYESGNLPPSNLRGLPSRRPASLRRQWRRWSKTNGQPAQKVTPLPARRSQVSLPQIAPRPQEAAPPPQLPESPSPSAFASRFNLAPPEFLSVEPPTFPESRLQRFQRHLPPVDPPILPTETEGLRSRPSHSGPPHSQPRTPPPPKTRRPRPTSTGTVARSPRPRREKRHRRSLPKPALPLLYGARLLVLGVGMSAIAGTLLSLRDPATRLSEVEASTMGVTGSPQAMVEATTHWQLDREPESLKQSVQEAIAAYPNLSVGVFAFDVRTGTYLDIEATTAFSAASTIKLPVAVAFFQAVDAGEIRLDEPLILQPQHIVGGSGQMQQQPPGTQYNALDVAVKMMSDSDNTATNLLVDRLGGTKTLNPIFRSWGLEQTRLQNPLPDLEGNNMTAPQDLALVLARIERGELLSLASRDRLLAMMRQTHNETLLPASLGEGAIVAHKTGNIGTVLADAGLIDTPGGRRYIVVTIVRRPQNDDRAAEAIRDVSQRIYQYLEPTLPGTPLTETETDLASTTMPSRQATPTQN